MSFRRSFCLAECLLGRGALEILERTVGQAQYGFELVVVDIEFVEHEVSVTVVDRTPSGVRRLLASGQFQVPAIAISSFGISVETKVAAFQLEIDDQPVREVFADERAAGGSQILV